MNDLYHWNAEVMVHLEMEEFRKEIEKIRLVHDAGLSNPSFLQRIVITFANNLGKMGHRLQENITKPHQAYQVTSSKYAG